MTFNEYQELASTFAIFPKGEPEVAFLKTGQIDPSLLYLSLGLSGEAGETAEKMKKILRDKNGIINEETKQELKKELGDILWYISQFSLHLGIKMEDLAIFNIDKLTSRQLRNKLTGEGDNR